MVRDRRLAEDERLVEVAHAALADGETIHDRHARRIGERLERGGEGFRVPRGEWLDVGAAADGLKNREGFH